MTLTAYLAVVDRDALESPSPVPVHVNLEEDHRLDMETDGKGESTILTPIRLRCKYERLSEIREQTYQCWHC